MEIWYQTMTDFHHIHLFEGPIGLSGDDKLAHHFSGGGANQEACLQVRVGRGQNSTLGFLAKANLNQAATVARHCSPSQFFTDRHGRCE